ncbi:MAG: efflux pump, family, rane fusion protein, partial [Deltaproteobacteria bacterium]|nr:efflux pump, family, rane fusion protein [Deltaproteobacteria bacterium]
MTANGSVKGEVGIMKRILFGILILLALGGIAFILFGKKENALNFRTEKVSNGDIVSTVTATGTVNAMTTVLVGTQVSGT